VRIALMGLGRMGGNMARRLCRRGIQVVGYNRSQEIVRRLAAEEGMIPAASIAEAVEQLTAPRAVWLMLPSGEPTEHVLQEVAALSSPGDVIIDGGNADYHDSQRRGNSLARQGIYFVDAGTSGGIWGLDHGYCLMVGGDAYAVGLLEPVFKALAPAPDSGWAHVGPTGAGHFTKMIHNGIEYGMMQALAEGFALLRGKQEFALDLARVAELWRHGSVVRSWLLDLIAQALQEDQALASVSPYVADSGEGRWATMEAVAQGQSAPVMALALHMRFASQDSEGYAFRLLARLRQAFGGHQLKVTHDA
jgi:6-phosphogluconate dehydrogenase